MSGQEECDVPQVSTNPLAPSNDNTPQPEFLNTFDWAPYNSNGPLNLPLNDIYEQNEATSMLHPYAAGNPYDYLQQAQINALDMYWDDGWELLSANLGNYPDGTATESEYLNMPYLLLYNRERGIIRFFANCSIAVENIEEFKFASVTLSFVDGNVSGLLRQNADYDRTLDQPTAVTDVKNLVALPDDYDQWFHTDFRVSYDPCTCVFRSDLKLFVRFLHEGQDVLVDREGMTDQAQIEFIDNADSFLETSYLPSKVVTPFETSVSYNGDGLLIYTESQKLYDDALSRLNYIKQHLTTLSQSTAQIEKEITIVQTMKALMIPGSNGLVSGSLTTDISTHIGQYVTAYEAGGWRMNMPLLTKEFNGIMARNFDWSSYEFREDNGVISQTTFPDANLSRSSYSGTFQFGLSREFEFFNPGTYPDAGIPIAEVTPHTYPVYNNDLGLFAVLNEPKFLVHEDEDIIEYDIYRNTFYDEDANCNTNGPFIWDRFTFRERNFTTRFKLQEPLKIVFNPHAGIDVSEVKISAELVFATYDPEAVTDGDAVVMTTPTGYEMPAGRYYAELKPEDYQSELVGQTNLLQRYSLGASPISSSLVYFQTPTLPLDAFNELTFALSYSSSQKWRDNVQGHYTSYGVIYWADDFVCDNADNILNPQIDVLIEDHWPHAEPQDVILKLIVEMPILSDDHNGQTKSMVQTSSFRLDQSSFVETQNEIAMPYVIYSTTGNETMQINEFPEYFVKNWTNADITNTPSWLMSGNLLVLQPTGLDAIKISGAQSKSSEVEEVEFRASQEIWVAGDVTIPEGFTLKLQEPWTESETPTVTSSLLSNFCNGIAPTSYLAHAAMPESAQDNFLVNYNYLKSDLIYETNLQAYPNPASTQINLSLLNIAGQVQFTIFNTLGVVVETFTQVVDGGRTLNYVSHSIAHLPDGTYTIAAQSASQSSTRQFVVIH